MSDVSFKQQVFNETHCDNSEQLQDSPQPTIQKHVPAIGDYSKLQNEVVMQVGERSVTKISNEQASNLVFDYANSADKEKYLNFLEGKNLNKKDITNASFSSYNKNIPKISYLVALDKFANALSYLITQAKNDPTRNNSFIMQTSCLDHIVALSIKIERENICVEAYNPKNNPTTQHKEELKYDSITKITLQSHAKNILEYMLQNADKKMQYNIEFNSATIYSVVANTNAKDFDITVIADEQDQKRLITNSMFCGIELSCFHDTNCMALNIDDLYTNLINYINKPTADFITDIMEADHHLAARVIFNNILKSNISEEEKINTLTRFQVLYKGFKTKDSKALVEFATTVVKSDLSIEGKAKILGGYYDVNNGLTGFLLRALSTIEPKTNQQNSINYIEAIFDNCPTANDVCDIFIALNKKIAPQTLLRFAIAEENYNFVVNFFKLVLQDKNLNDGHKVLLLADKDKSSRNFLSFLIKNNEENVAIAYMAMIVSSDLDLYMKVILLDTPEFQYDRRFSLTELYQNHPDCLIATLQEIKIILLSENISAHQKLAKFLKPSLFSKLSLFSKSMQFVG